MEVAIGHDGAPMDVKVTQSSGSERLDTAAATYIKTHWRWHPPSETCRSASAAVNVAWHLVSEPPVAKSTVRMERGVEIMAIYTLRVQTME
jgi:outer membrane biosynthesis protein TonB